jgi:hypothetical protein
MNITITLKYKETILISAILIITHLAFTSLIESFAIPYSFSLQEIRDEPFDSYLNNIRSVGLPYTDILTANYFSNGNNLTGILWLSAPFKNFISPDKGKINYGMFIDADLNTATGISGIDLQLEISGQNGTWTKTLRQYSSIEGTNRTLYEKKNYSGFHGDKSDKYVILSINMDVVGSPDKYKFIFYAEQQLNNSISKIDYTNWIQVPKPDFDITFVPDSLELTKGEEKTIELNLKSTTDLEPIVHLFTNDSNTQNIGLNFTSISFHLPSHGIKSIPVNVSTKDSTIGQETILISANATFPSVGLIRSNHQANNTFTIPSFVKNENLTKQSSITITVNPEMSKIDQFLQSLDKWEFPISFISGLLIGHIAPWLINKIRSKREKRNDNKSFIDWE